MPADGVAAAARRYVPGVGAVALERLGRGLVNESYRVTRDGRRYSLRTPAATHVPIGVDRDWECRVLSAASAAGIAPQIECCEPRRGVLVARWEEGTALSLAQARRPATSARVAALARRVHAVVVPGKARIMRPADWIEHYRAAVPRTHELAAGDLRLQAEVGRRLAALEASPATADVLCHSDLHPGNLVASGRGLVLLDWEYAHVSEALWDIAGWACNTDLAPAAGNALLASYLGRAAAREEERRLADLAWLYDYVCLLWSEVYCGATDASDRLILERGRALAARLARQAGGEAGELPAN